MSDVVSLIMSNITSDIDVIISSLDPSGKFNVVHRLVILVWQVTSFIQCHEKSSVLTINIVFEENQRYYNELYCTISKMIDNTY